MQISILIKKEKKFQDSYQSICWKQILFKHPILGFVLNFIFFLNNFTDLKLQKIHGVLFYPKLYFQNLNQLIIFSRTCKPNTRKKFQDIKDPA